MKAFGLSVTIIALAGTAQASFTGFDVVSGIAASTYAADPEGDLGAPKFGIYTADESIPFITKDAPFGGVVPASDPDPFFAVFGNTSFNETVDSAVWTFDISNLEDLQLSIDMGANVFFADYSNGDTFTFSYSIDGGDDLDVFTPVSVGSFLFLDGELLGDSLATYSSSISGTGSTLSLIFNTQFFGASNALVFRNINLSGSEIPAPSALGLLATAGASCARRRRA